MIDLIIFLAGVYVVVKASRAFYWLVIIDRSGKSGKMNYYLKNPRIIGPGGKNDAAS